MPELTVYAEASGGYIRSENQHDNYAHALSGDPFFATVTAFTNATATVGIHSAKKLHQVS